MWPGQSSGVRGFKLGMLGASPDRRAADALLLDAPLALVVIGSVTDSRLECFLFTCCPIPLPSEFKGVSEAEFLDSRAWEEEGDDRSGREVSSARRTGPPLEAVAFEVADGRAEASLARLPKSSKSRCSSKLRSCIMSMEISFSWVVFPCLGGGERLRRSGKGGRGPSRGAWVRRSICLSSSRSTRSCVSSSDTSSIFSCSRVSQQPASPKETDRWEGLGRHQEQMGNGMTVYFLLVFLWCHFIQMTSKRSKLPNQGASSLEVVVWLLDTYALLAQGPCQILHGEHIFLVLFLFLIFFYQKELELN